MWKLSLFIMALSFTAKVQAAEVPISIVNTCYDIPTKLEGTVKYRNMQEVTISEIIPAMSVQTGNAYTALKIPQGAVNNIELVLTTLRKDTPYPDLAATLIAQALYTPQFHALQSLTITIGCQELQFKTAYNLPPLFNEQK